jgi:hypothetical protein
MMSENISATPNVPQTNRDSILKSSGGVKSATPDIILFNENALPVDAMSHLIFENIGGHEMINMLRYDTIDGKNVSHRLIGNTQAVSRAFSPSNITNPAGSINEYFKNFAIRLEARQVETNEPNYRNVLYVDRELFPGSLVLEVTNMRANEQVEIQVLNSGDYLSAIIESINAEEF